MRYTISDIRHYSLESGSHFFTRQTMRFFGDTVRSFAVRHMPDGTIELERVRPMRDRSGRSMGGVGKRYKVNTETWDIVSC